MLIFEPRLQTAVLTCRGKWHQEQLEKARNVSGKQTDHFYDRLEGVLMQLFNIVILIAVIDFVIRDEDGSGNDGRKIAGVLVFELLVAGIVFLAVVQRLVQAYSRQLRRVLIIVAFGAVILLFALFVLYFEDNPSAGLRDLVLLFFANLVLGTVIVQLALYIAPFNAASCLLYTSPSPRD